jgi:hypothetical protein
LFTVLFVLLIRVAGAGNWSLISANALRIQKLETKSIALHAQNGCKVCPPPPLPPMAARFALACFCFAFYLARVPRRYRFLFIPSCRCVHWRPQGCRRVSGKPPTCWHSAALTDVLVSFCGSLANSSSCCKKCAVRACRRWYTCGVASMCLDALLAQLGRDMVVVDTCIFSQADLEKLLLEFCELLLFFLRAASCDVMRRCLCRKLQYAGRRHPSQFLDAHAAAFS